MRTASRVTLNTLILYVKIGVTTVVSLYSVRLILDALGVQDYGIYNLVAGTIAMLQFLNEALTASSQRFMSFAQGKGELYKQRSVFNVSLLLHVIVAIFMLFFLEILGIYFFNFVLNIPVLRLNAAWIVYQCMIATTLLTILVVPYDAVINAREKFIYYASIDIFNSFLKLALAVSLLTYAGDRLIFYSLVWIAITLLNLILKLFYCRRFTECKFNLKKYFDKKLAKEMLGFGGWSFLGSASSMTAMYGVGLILNNFFGVLLNAAQGVANQVSGQLMSVSTTLMKAVNPVIVKNEGSNNHSSAILAALTASKFSVFLLTIVSVPILLETHFVFNIWLKQIPQYAILFCQLSLLRSIINQLTASYQTLLGATGNIRNYQIAESIIYILSLPISALLFYLGAFPWVIYVVLVFMVLGLLVVRLYYAKLECQLNYSVFFNSIGKQSISVFLVVYILALFISSFFDYGLIRFLIVLIVVFLTSPLAIYCLGLNLQEKKYFKSFAVELKNKIMRIKL